MMHTSPTSLLKRNHIKAPSVVMPSLMLPMTSNSVQGQYLLSERDSFHGLPTSTKQPIQASLIQYPEQINLSLDQHYEPARKKRLTIDQTRSLERSFAADTRLEPETKNQLARELGLQPRQVAIWYQNRRARTKTKDLEEKYDALHMQYQGVLEANRKLEAEVIKLREVLGLQEKVNLVAKGAKSFVEKKQDNKSISDLSTNRVEAALSTIERPQQQTHKQSKSKEETVDSEDKSCATTQSKPAHDVTSMARDCTYNQSNNMLKHVCETAGIPIHQEEMGHLNHQVFTHMLDNHQHQHQHQIQQPHHHELLRHFQHHYQLSCFSNLVGDVKLENYEYPVPPSTSLNQFDGHLVDDYRFNLEDETASLYFELATQA